ncbi:hypothetical protein Cfla_3053 [Cellulomonas flavigena DSM 20109]|uniref:Uncharacterized protein n=1 Tax=Cellulomonas flavigena (strain ATCC 482 / DSM 20109 / BCRC 11376 / JCM 18109 / NBRC 3775 / NCIMB 8073 / NRS 134) TaxID=446466 RepID=D5UL54_CELFN|nr:hypothetical protein Cfla_3053 [Cellulomonas flavigena DSM 20109]
MGRARLGAAPAGGATGAAHGTVTFDLHDASGGSTGRFARFAQPWVGRFR